MWMKSIQILRITTVLFLFACCGKNDTTVMDFMRTVSHLLIMDDGYTGLIRFIRHDVCHKHSESCGNGTSESYPSENHCKWSLRTYIKQSLRNFEVRAEQRCLLQRNDSRNWNQTGNAHILSLDTDKTGELFRDEYGIEIQKDGELYLIYLLKSYFREDHPILCFLPGFCRRNWTGQPGICQGAIRLNSCKTNFMFNETLCKNYTNNMRIISINAKVKTQENSKTCMYETTCVTCKNPVNEPKINIDMNVSIDVSANGEVDATDAAKAMKSLSSVLKNLGKEYSARVTIGPIKGILKKQQMKTEFNDFFFGITADSYVQDIDETAALERLLPGLVSVPKEAFYKANLSSSNEPFVAVFRIPNMTKDATNSRILNSEAIAIEMAADIRNLTDPINITFMKVQDGVEMVCSSWNGEGDGPVWTTDGCHTLESNDTITCQCTHLTFFAILMASPGINISSSDLKSLTYITYIGCGMSMFFLGIALFMHFLLRRGKANNITLILMNLFLAMFLLNLFFLSNEGVARLGNPIICKILAAAMHFSMLSTFTWFAVEAFHLCFQLTKSFKITIKHYILKVCIAGWALPCVVMSVLVSLGKYGSLTINSDNEKTVKMCWVIDSTVHYVVNIGYYVIVFLFTFTIFIIIATRLMHPRKVDTDVSKKDMGPKNIFSILGLCCLLGITWGFAFFSHGPLRIPSYYIFTILNSFQGFFLFLYYYNTNKIAGEKQAVSFSAQSTSTIKTTMDTLNPYLS